MNSNEGRREHVEPASETPLDTTTASVRTMVVLLAVLTLAAVGALMFSGDFPDESARAPQVIAVAMLGLLVVAWIRELPRLFAVLRDGKQRAQFLDLRDALNPSLVTGIASIVYLLVMPYLGFLISTVAFLAGLAYYLGMRRKVLRTVLFAAVSSGVLYWLFTEILYVRLPALPF